MKVSDSHQGHSQSPHYNSGSFFSGEKEAFFSGQLSTATQGAFGDAGDPSSAHGYLEGAGEERESLPEESAPAPIQMQANDAAPPEDPPGDPDTNDSPAPDAGGGSDPQQPPSPAPTPPPALATPSISLTPGNTLTRGDNLAARVSFSPTAGESLNVTGWSYATAAHGTVNRSARAATFQTEWAGTMAVSGTLELRFQITPAGGSPGAEQSVTEDITVNNRTASMFQSTVTQNPEGVFGGRPSPPRIFRDLGNHSGAIRLPTLTPQTIADGPNHRFQFIGSLTAGTYSSTPSIHPDVTDATSTFFTFHQDPSRLYVRNSPSSRSLIPLADYSGLSVSSGTVTFTTPDFETFFKNHNVITVRATGGGRTVTVPDAHWGLDSNAMTANVEITNDGAVRSLLRLRPSQTYTFNFNRKSFEGFELMQAADIRDGTRSHEFQHAEHSHRANFLKMMRALDPQKVIERKVSAPGHRVRFSRVLSNLRTQILAPDHELVDEAASATAESFVAQTGVSMAGVNTDPATGADLGSVWNISGDRVMT